MLNNMRGYAVMNKELDSYGIEDAGLETCKKYCRGTDVVVERLPVVRGFSIRIMWREYCKPFEIRKYLNKNILWLHWSVNKEYQHKNGKIVFRADENK
jgi:hypothetical protein